jgi:8-oxo-dGTP pyrophosphatase MutT (NUDIX family)
MASPPPELTALPNIYGDLSTTRPSEFSRDAAQFDAQLHSLLARARRGVWLALPWDRADLLPALAARGFAPHHWARDESELVLQCWRASGEEANPTPPAPHVDVGCAAFVINRDGALLAIRERYQQSDSYGVPGGHLDRGETLFDCAVREAREETGVACAPLGVAALHEVQRLARPAAASDAELAAHAQSVRFGTAHVGVYIVCYATALGVPLAPDPAEVAEARWLPPADWHLLSPHIRALLAAAEAGGAIAEAASLSAAAAASSGGSGSFSFGGSVAGAAPAECGLIGAHALTLPGRRSGAPQQHVIYHASSARFVGALARAGLGAAAAAARPLMPIAAGASGGRARVFSAAAALGFAAAAFAVGYAVGARRRV